MAFRLVVWNCAMGLDKKYERLLSLRPDVAVIPECAEPDILRKKAPDFSFADCEWSGSLKDKGLGVFAFDGHTLRRHDSWERRFHIFIPIEVRGATAINLLALWAFNHRAPTSNTIAATDEVSVTVAANPPTTAAAVEHYAAFLRACPSVVAGDFNANVIWDKGGRYASFAKLNEALEGIGLKSAYHAKTGEKFGEEKSPTLFWQRNADKPYHIDYAYLPNAASKDLDVKVGPADEWLKYSDHAPLITEFDVPNRR